MIILIKNEKTIGEYVSSYTYKKLKDMYSLKEISFSKIDEKEAEIKSYLLSDLTSEMLFDMNTIHIYNNIKDIFYDEDSLNKLAAILNAVSETTHHRICTNLDITSDIVSDFYKNTDTLENVNIIELVDNIIKDGLNESLPEKENIMDNLDAEDAYNIENILNSD